MPPNKPVRRLVHHSRLAPGPQPQNWRHPELQSRPGPRIRAGRRPRLYPLPPCSRQGSSLSIPAPSPPSPLPSPPLPQTSGEPCTSSRSSECLTPHPRFRPPPRPSPPSPGVSIPNAPAAPSPSLGSPSPGPAGSLALEPRAVSTLRRSPASQIYIWRPLLPPVPRNFWKVGKASGGRPGSTKKSQRPPPNRPGSRPLPLRTLLAPGSYCPPRRTGRGSGDPRREAARDRTTCGAHGRPRLSADSGPLWSWRAGRGGGSADHWAVGDAGLQGPASREEPPPGPTLCAQATFLPASLSLQRLCLSGSSPPGWKLNWVPLHAPSSVSFPLLCLSGEGSGVGRQLPCSSAVYLEHLGASSTSVTGPEVERDGPDSVRDPPRGKPWSDRGRDTSRTSGGLAGPGGVHRRENPGCPPSNMLCDPKPGTFFFWASAPLAVNCDVKSFLASLPSLSLSVSLSPWSPCPLPVWSPPTGSRSHYQLLSPRPPTADSLLSSEPSGGILFCSRC